MGEKRKKRRALRRALATRVRAGRETRLREEDRGSGLGLLLQHDVDDDEHHQGDYRKPCMKTWGVF